MISINKESNIKMYEQLYDQIKRDILDGHLISGKKLPSTRKLSEELGVSRNTVINAYNQLELEGYIKSALGSGYFVQAITGMYPEQTKADMQGRIKTGKSEKNYDYIFSYGNLDYSCYQSKNWRKCLMEACDMIASSNAASYQMSKGSNTLRKLIKEHLHTTRGVVCDHEQIIITSGHQCSMDIISNLFDPDKWTFAMEDPGYNGTYEIISRHPFTIIPIPLEEDGVSLSCVKALRDTLLYVTPSHQFPMGKILSISKRFELIGWAKDNNSYIIEDDYDSELRYQSKPIPSLQSIDQNERTIYLGTFSKSMSPDLRVSYIVLPKALMYTFEDRYAHTNCTVSTLLQLALCEFIKSGQYQRHINAMRTHYKKKHDYISSYVKQNLNHKVRLLGSGAGLHFVLEIDTELQQEDIIKRFEDENIKVYPTKPFWIDKEKCPGNQLLFGFSSIPSEKLPRAMDQFAKVARTL